MPDTGVATSAPSVAAGSVRGRPWHKYGSFGGMACGWLLISFLATRPNDMHVLQAGLGILFFGLLVFVALTYAGTMRREYALAVFEREGWLHSLLSRRLLRGCAWLLFAAATGFVLFLQMHAYSAVEWGALSLVLIVFPVSFAWFRRAARGEMREDMADSMALLLARRTCPAILAVLYVFAVALIGDLPRHESLHASIDAYRTAPIEWNGSELIRQGLYWAAYFDGLKAYAVSHLGEFGALPALVLLMIAKYAIFLGACFALTPLLVSPAEFRRARMVPRWSMVTVALLSVGIASAYTLNHLDHLAATSQTLRDFRVTVEKTSVELIDGRVYLEGARADVLALGGEASRRVEGEVDVLRRGMDAMFQTLEAEAVSEYLDWYYSYPAAFFRLLDSVEDATEWLATESDAEDVDSRMAERLREVFGRQFPDVEAAHAAVPAVWRWEALQLDRDARSVLAKNRLVPVPRDYETAWEGSLDEMLASALPGDIVPPGAMGATAAAGTLSAMFARAFAARALQKPAFKTAGKSLTRAATTAAKGILGGVLAAVGVEALSLEIEEALKRDDFERQLVHAIREARLEFDQRYFAVSEGDGAPDEQMDACQVTADPSRSVMGASASCMSRGV